MGLVTLKIRYSCTEDLRLVYLTCIKADPKASCAAVKEEQSMFREFTLRVPASDTAELLRSLQIRPVSYQIDEN